MAQHIRFDTIIPIIVTSLLLSACAAQPHKELSEVMRLQQQAQTAYNEGDLVQAQSDYLELTRILPGDESSWFHLGNVYARAGQLELAVNAYRHVLAHDATHAKAWHNLGVVLMQQSQAAFIQCARVARADPDLQRASLDMGQTLETLIHPSSPPAQEQVVSPPLPPVVKGDETTIGGTRQTTEVEPPVADVEAPPPGAVRAP